MKCIVIEDEKPAQNILSNYIEKTDFLECIGMFSQATAVPSNLLQIVDVLFLDIQLPIISGVSYLKSLQKKPMVIFTTAFPDYAVEAFTLQVVDYLVKPFSYERFFSAVQKANSMMPPLEKDFFIYTDKTFYRISAEEILWVEAAVDYVKIVTDAKVYWVAESLTQWENKLQAWGFLRVHRSFLVNKHQITKIQGNQIFVQTHTIPIGRSYRESFLKQLGHH